MCSHSWLNQHWIRGTFINKFQSPFVKVWNVWSFLPWLWSIYLCTVQFRTDMKVSNYDFEVKTNNEVLLHIMSEVYFKPLYYCEACSEGGEVIVHFIHFLNHNFCLRLIVTRTRHEIVLYYTYFFISQYGPKYPSIILPSNVLNQG